MREEKIRVIMLHSDYSSHPNKHNNNSFFGRNMILHKELEKATGLDIHWQFFGGFISKEKEIFWKAISKANVFLCLPSNMNNDDINMHWGHAEANMFEQVQKIKKLNPKIKIIYFEHAHFENDGLSKHGNFVEDIHQLNKIAQLIK